LLFLGQKKQELCMGTKLISAMLPVGLALTLAACSGSRGNDSATANGAGSNVTGMGQDGAAGGNMADSMAGGADGTGAATNMSDNSADMTNNGASNATGGSGGGGNSSH
jgi:hypothetical protein